MIKTIQLGRNLLKNKKLILINKKEINLRQKMN